jgi:hypothetical protein
MSDWKLAYHANCRGALWGDAVGVTSITRLAYRTFGQMDRALSDIAAAGYERVEVFEGNLLDHSAADFRSLLANTGLHLVAPYAGGNFIYDDIMPEELARVTRAADRAGELGAPHLVVGAGPSGLMVPARRISTSLPPRWTESRTWPRRVACGPIITRICRRSLRAPRRSARSST